MVEMFPEDVESGLVVEVEEILAEDALEHLQQSGEVFRGIVHPKRITAHEIQTAASALDWQHLFRRDQISPKT